MRLIPNKLFSDWYDSLPYGEPTYQETFEAGQRHAGNCPNDWSVFNTGAEVASGLSYADAMGYMTLDRINRGWTLVCVMDKSNLEKAA